MQAAAGQSGQLSLVVEPYPVEVESPREWSILDELIDDKPKPQLSCPILDELIDGDDRVCLSARITGDSGPSSAETKKSSGLDVFDYLMKSTDECTNKANVQPVAATTCPSAVADKLRSHSSALVKPPCDGSSRKETIHKIARKKLQPSSLLPDVKTCRDCRKHKFPNDYWEKGPGAWVRVHCRPRKDMFVPTGTKDGPLISDLEGTRVTDVHVVHTGEHTEIRDRWIDGTRSSRSLNK